MGSCRIARLCGTLGLLTALGGCGGHEMPEVTAARTSTLSVALVAEDTFINSALPDNNNGHSASIYTGRNGQSGDMRALIKFALPPELQGRVTVTSAQLTMTTRGLSNTGTAPPTAATGSLQAVTEAWSAGNGEDDGGAGMHIPGQACGGAVVGATWNRPDCALAASWAAPGGTIASAISGQTSVPAAIDAAVVWSSTVAMVADVQGWIDAPASNRGWRITSSTEGGAGGLAQRFYSAEAPTGSPMLVVVYDCKAGFTGMASRCTSCTATALAACRTGVVGNSCVDEAPDAVAPTAGYSCRCGAGYVATGGATPRCEASGAGAGGISGAGGAAAPDAAADGRAGGGAGAGGPNPNGGSGCSCAILGRGALDGVSAGLSIVALVWMARRRRA